MTLCSQFMNVICFPYLLPAPFTLHLYTCNVCSIAGFQTSLPLNLHVALKLLGQMHVPYDESSWI